MLSAVISYTVSKNTITNSMIAAKQNELMVLDDRIRDTYAQSREKLNILADDNAFNQYVQAIAQAETLFDYAKNTQFLQSYLNSTLFSMKEFGSLYLFQPKFVIGVERNNSRDLTRFTDAPNVEYPAGDEEKVTAALLASLAVFNNQKAIVKSHLVISRLNCGGYIVGILDFNVFFENKEAGAAADTTAIFNEKGETVYCNKDDKPTAAMLNRYRRKLAAGGANFFEGKDKIITYYQSPYGGLEYLRLEESKVINAKFARALWLTLVISFLIFVWFFAFLVQFSKRLTKPIEQFGKVISGVNGFDKLQHIEAFISSQRDKLSLKAKLFLFYLVCIIPLILVMTANYFLFKDIVMNETVNNLYQTVEQTRESIEYKVKSYLMLAQYLSLDAQVQNELIQIFSQKAQSGNQSDLSSQKAPSGFQAARGPARPWGDAGSGPDQSIMPRIILNKGILAQNLLFVKFYNRDYHLIYASNNSSNLKIEKEAQWRQAMADKFSQGIWEVSDTREQSLVMIYKIRYLPRNNSVIRPFARLGFLEMGLKEFLSEKIDLPQLDYDGSIYITDAAQKILFASKRHNFSKELVGGLLKNQRPPHSPAKTIKIQSGRNMLCIMPIKDTPWSLVTMVAVPSISKEHNKILVYNLYVVAALVFIVLLISEIFTVTIVKPLTQLEQYMRRADTGKTELTLQNKDNEFTSLAANFKEMLQRLQSLGEKVKEQELESLELEKRKKEAQLTALQTQINPHFIYNIFTSINFLLRMNQNDKAAEMITATGKLLRVGIYRGNQIVAVKEELDHVRAYVEIQKMRHHDRILVDFQVAAGVDGYQIPKFILQPLVENAIEHGFAKREYLRIAIKVYLQNDSLLLVEVADDGAGIAAEELAQIRIRLTDGTQSKHIGLTNVNERIQLFYGMEYTMQIESRVGVGTKVMIRLPAVKEC